MINLNSGSNFVPGRGPAGADPPISEAINAAIDRGLVEARAGQPRRSYLGASVLGDPCMRKLVYEYRHEPIVPFDGLTLRIFDAGHAFEELSIRWLRAGGFDLRDRNPNTGLQYEFETARGQIEGHADGVIVAGPAIGLHYPVLWEHKALNQKSWSDLVKRGLAASKEVYYGQVQLYMGYLQFAECLFTALNKNSCELYHEIVPFNLAEAQRLSDRAVDIIRTAETSGLPPRIAAQPDNFSCRDCGFAPTCWSPA
jgi:hypothetical protein